MTWRVRDGELPLSRTLEDPKLHYGRISTTQKDGTPPFPRRNAHSKTLYSTWSLLLDAQSPCVVLLVVLGFVRCLRWKMGTKLGRSQLRVKLVGRFSRARTVGTPLLSRLDAAETPHLPCLEGQVWFPGATHRAIKRFPKSVEAVMEDCTESRQIWNDTLGEQSWNQVETTVPAAMGPCAPSELVLHSSGFVVTSQHSVISGCVETRVDCAVSHGFGTSPAHLARSQPFVGTQCAHVGYPGVELMSRATYISRKKRNLETVQRQSKALKKAQWVRNASSSHNQPAQTRNFLVPYTSATISPCCMGTRTCFSVHSVVPSTLVEL